MANWTWGYFAVDFIRENDGWKIWHMQYVNDVDCICGQSWGRASSLIPSCRSLPRWASSAIRPTRWRAPCAGCIPPTDR